MADHCKLEDYIKEQKIKIYDFKNIEIVRQISGAYGIVRKSVLYEEFDVALKIIQIDEEDKIIEEYVREISILQQVSNHPNIIEFYGITKECLRNIEPSPERQFYSSPEPQNKDPVECPKTILMIECPENIEPLPKRQSHSSSEPQNEDPVENPETMSIIECQENIEPLPKRQSHSSSEPQNEDPVENPETMSIIECQENIEQHSHSETSSPEYSPHPPLEPQFINFLKQSTLVTIEHAFEIASQISQPQCYDRISTKFKLLLKNAGKFDNN
ncbi:10490_t:CDS:2 [Racocetra fulgida]|uniref:10490_t:CDS:1 n=1 Tax=Racocetra fulgida TaxID=60492 RepID=A0A9N8WJD8_9GLOM|nr:10490_t:CDS:2 [Racocetra fulgida]